VEEKEKEEEEEEKKGKRRKGEALFISGSSQSLD